MRQSNGQFAAIDDPMEYWKSKVRITYPIITSCWEWTGLLFPKGYGYFKCKALGKPMPASRATWLMFFGPIPKGKFVCHKCDNRKCCNPDHLFLGTQKQNMEDCVEKGRMNKGEDRPQSKMTNEKVIELRRLYAKGWSFRELANHFKIGPSNAHRIAKGNAWKHIS